MRCAALEVRSFATYGLAIILSFLPTPGSAKMDIMIDGVPLPADISPAAGDSARSPFAGMWAGLWDGSIKTILAVERITDEGKASVVYAVGASPQSGTEGAWFRYDAEIADGKMTMFGKRLSVTFEHSETGRLRAVLGDGFGFGVLTRQSLDILDRPDAGVAWRAGTSELLETTLVEGGEPVRLETVVYRPAGAGPFPLAVVNHGSTGAGDDVVAFTETWENAWLADVLNERGWIVAFPQRRGRGKSDGLYDEGFAADRRDGYTCETERSLAGADRALEDLQAAIDALRRRPDVGPGPILLAGNSRGGVLSVAYAGLYPDQAKAVINFVGGWIGDGCDTADAINGSLFAKGAGFPRPTLWLYGRDDYFYSMDHSRKNFDAFRQAGGKGAFVEVTVPGDGNGHWVMAVPPLWQAHVLAYLDSVKD